MIGCAEEWDLNQYVGSSINQIGIYNYLRSFHLVCIYVLNFLCGAIVNSNLSRL
jgi:hypothetical protein